MRPELPTAACVRCKRRPPPWTTPHLGNPLGVHLKLGESCSDKRSHFCFGPLAQYGAKQLVRRDAHLVAEVQVLRRQAGATLVLVALHLA